MEAVSANLPPKTETRPNFVLFVPSVVLKSKRVLFVFFVVFCKSFSCSADLPGLSPSSI